MTSTVDLVPTDPPQLVLSTSPGNQTIVTLDDDMVREIHWLTGCWLAASEAEPEDNRVGRSLCSICGRPDFTHAFLTPTD